MDGIRLLHPIPAHLWYFGDLDVSGIRMAAAADIAGRNLGLPPLCPATALYGWLRDHGVPQKDRSSRSLAVVPGQATNWFPSDLAQFSDELLRQRLRVPQETVGLNVLRAHPELIMDLAQT